MHVEKDEFIKLNDEFWVIEQYPDYEISRCGEVRRIKTGKVANVDQYGRVQLCCNGKRSMVKWKDLLKSMDFHKAVKSPRPASDKKKDESKEVAALKHEIWQLENELAEMASDFAKYKEKMRLTYEGYYPSMEINPYEDQEINTLECFTWGVPTNKYLDLYFDQETLLPLFSPYTGGPITNDSRTFQKIKKIAETKFCEPYKVLMTYAEPCIKSVKNNDQNYWDSTFKIHYCGCAMLGMLMSDVNFRKLVHKIH